MPYSDTGSKNDLYPEQIRFEENKSLKQRTFLEKCLIFLAVALFILAVILAALVVVFYIKSESDDDSSKKVCTSRDCVTAASSIALKMDTDANPCQDFAQYACGGFYKEVTLPDDKNTYNSFTYATEKNEKILRKILEEESEKDDPKYVKKMKTYYRTCLDEDTIEKIGITPYLASSEAKDWPTLNPSWDSASFDLNAVIERYERVFVESIFIYIVTKDLENSTRHQLHIAQPSLGLPLKYLKLPRNDHAIMAYQKFYEDYSVALGADPTTARNDAESLVDFERELANISVTAEESIDMSTMNNPSTLNKMSTDYPFIDWHRAIQAAFDTINKTIPKDLAIVNRNPKFFNQLQAVLNATDKRVIQNRFGFNYATKYVGALTKELRQIHMDYLKARFGFKTEQSRWKQCVGAASGVFRAAVGKAFVAQTFTEDSKYYMDTMIGNLKTAFGELLKEGEWMEAQTKEAALLKLKTMKRKIGYPDKGFDIPDIEKQYENYTVLDGQMQETDKAMVMEINKEGLKNLDKPVDTNIWQMNVFDVNAYYGGPSNEIAFPAGILQPPFFSAQFPSSVNYGAIGAVIGHEITHGYDQSGSQFDHMGNLKNWWQLKDLKEFKKRTQCVIDQYSAFNIKEINMNLNGKLTAGENTADIGGLKEAYRAYKAYAASQPEELPLPGLGLTTDQQFFVAFSQLWCSKATDGALRSKALTGVHSPGRFRIKGALQSSEDFARVFKCPRNSTMNPVKKCVVW